MGVPVSGVPSVFAAGLTAGSVVASFGASTEPLSGCDVSGALDANLPSGPRTAPSGGFAPTDSGLAPSTLLAGLPREEAEVSAEGGGGDWEDVSDEGEPDEAASAATAAVRASRMLNSYPCVPDRSRSMASLMLGPALDIFGGVFRLNGSFPSSTTPCRLMWSRWAERDVMTVPSIGDL